RPAAEWPTSDPGDAESHRARRSGQCRKCDPMSWPHEVWAAPLLRDLDTRARIEIERSGRLRDVVPGKRLYRPGAPADSFFVVASGSVKVEIARRGHADGSAERSARAGEVLGIEAAMRPGGTRQGEACGATKGIAAEIPLVVFRRAAARAGEGEA